MRRSLLGPVLAVLALAAVTGLWFSSCERRTETVYTGLQGEARENPYLAAQRLLEAMGADVRSVETVEALDPLPAPDATLIVPVNRNGLRPQRSERLLEWARAGGNLIVVTWSLWEDEERTPDPVVDPLDIRQYMWALDDDLFAEEDAPEEQVARIAWPDRPEPLRAEFEPDYYLLQGEISPRARVAASDAYGTHLLTVPAGAGLVTVLTDDVFLSNAAIGDLDHAELVWRLARPDGRTGPVWLVWSTRYRSAWALLLEHGWMVLASLGLLLGGWVWWRAARFGPVRPDPPPERRRLMEHIEAAGRFQLRDGQQRALLDAVREALRARIAARHPGWLGLAPADLHERLAATTGVARERIDAALSYGDPRGEERFARRVTTLETIRKGL